MQIEPNEFATKAITVSNLDPCMSFRNLTPDKELFRVTAQGVMQVKVETTDENTKQFIDSVNQMLLQSSKRQAQLTKVEIVKEV